MRKFNVADVIQSKFINSHPEKVRKRHQLNCINNLVDPISDPYYRNYIYTHHKTTLQTADLLYDMLFEMVQDQNHKPYEFWEPE